MNIKSIRRNYEQLTMLERLSLLDKADSRDDKSEIRAIVTASPSEIYRQCDFYDLKREITTFRLCNLITRLSYVMKFDYFWGRASESAELKDDDAIISRLVDDARMSAFLYVRATDSWKTVNDEFDLRSDFDESVGALMFDIEILKIKEQLIREMAFTEEEASKYVAERGNIDGQIRTTEDEARSIRASLGLLSKRN